MKRFIENNLYVQGIDIKILLKYGEMDSDVRTQMSSIDTCNRDYEYIEILDGPVKDYLIESPYIIDYDLYSSYNMDQILSIQVQINNEMNNIYNMFTNSVDRDVNAYKKMFNQHKLFIHQLFLIDVVVADHRTKVFQPSKQEEVKTKKRKWNLFSFTK